MIGARKILVRWRSLAPYVLFKIHYRTSNYAVLAEKPKKHWLPVDNLMDGMHVCRHYYTNVGFSKKGAQCSCKLALLAGFENYTLCYTYYTLHITHNTHYTCYTLHTTHYTLKILDVKYTLNTTHYTFKWNITTHTTHTKHYTLHTTHITHYTYYTLYTNQVHTKH